MSASRGWQGIISRIAAVAKGERLERFGERFGHALMECFGHALMTGKSR